MNSPQFQGLKFQIMVGVVAQKRRLQEVGNGSAATPI